MIGDFLKQSNANHDAQERMTGRTMQWWEDVYKFWSHTGGSHPDTSLTWKKAECAYCLPQLILLCRSIS